MSFYAQRARTPAEVEMKATALAIRQEVGALRAEISVRLKMLGPGSTWNQRLLNIESSFMNHVDAKLDIVLNSVRGTHVDIHEISVDLERARDEARASTSDASSKTMATLLNFLPRTPTSGDQIMERIDCRLDRAHGDLKATVARKLDHMHTSLAQALASHPGGNWDARFSEVQKNIDSSRRRLTERMNNLHEGLAGIIHDLRERVEHKLDRFQA